MTDTASQDILVHTEAGVRTITFNRVDKKNSLTQAMYAQLAQVFADTAADDSVRVLLLQGAPTIFSAGNDIGDFLSSQQGEGDALPLDGPTLQFIYALANFPKPLLAAVAGPAVGIGCTMLLHCDLVYAGDNAAFSLPFVNLGLCPEAGSSLLLPRLMGHQRAAEALMLGEPFLAEAALEVGLVNRVVPPTEVNGVAHAQALKLAAKPLAALVQTKRLLKSAQHQQLQAHVAEEARSFSALMRGPAATEAFTAFMEKRKPNFSNC